MEKNIEKNMENMYDAIIVGGGPAGLSAAIYLARAKYKVLVMEKEKFGGQITITAEIVNYPGVEHASGSSLTESMRIQAERFGAEFMLAEVVSMKADGKLKTVTTADGREYRTVGIVLALGASPREVGFTGEQEYKGRGVAYCATCDGEFFAGREVLVIGGGFAAVEEAMFLTRYASKVTIIVREEAFTCAAGVVEKLRDFPDIDVRFHTEMTEVGGDGLVKYARLKDNKSGVETEYRAADGGVFGVFVFVGYAPATRWIAGQIALDKQGYIITDENRKTDCDGVYAAGDVCIKNLRQVVTAVSDGAVAATALEKYIADSGLAQGQPDKQKILSDSTAAANKSEEKRGISDSDVPNENFDDTFINGEMRKQLAGVFSRFEKTVTVVAVLNGTESSNELRKFAKELEGIHEKLLIETEKAASGTEYAYLDIRREGKSVGIRYYSVPGGHEFNSFISALYNVAGPGKPIAENVLEQISAIPEKHLLQVMATLSCTNCPDVVAGTQRIAALNDKICAEMYDISKFPALKERYQIMAVPCLVVDEEKTYFGKQNIEQILNILKPTD